MRQVNFSFLQACCRVLKLDSAPFHYLPIAGSNLQKLICGARNESEVLDIPAIATRTGLTELSLQRIPNVTDCHKLRSLALQRLSLMDCTGAEVELFVPGALTAFETLVICEAESDLIAFEERLRQDSAPEAEGQQFVRQVSEAGKALLSLPRLRVVRGKCKFFLLGIINEQIGWKRTFRISRCKSLACSCPSCRCTAQKWEKVQ